MDLIYLAAGRGSRLPKKFRGSPKCLVKIKGKSLFERNERFFSFFDKKFIITGYKSHKLEKISKKYNFKIIKNNKYFKTNMVYSMFLANRFISRDVVICYGDIIFDYKIIKFLKKSNNYLPVYTKWFGYWKKRMTLKNILNDAEDLVIKKNIVISIGGKIKKIPKYQYTGIIKLKKNKFKTLFNYFKLQDEKIDMTSFLNECIKEKKLKLNILKYNNYWHEIDNKIDIKIAEKSKQFI